MLHRSTAFLGSLLLGLFCSIGPVGSIPAVASEGALTWDNLCRTTVCRATGHDGVMDARLSPDGAHVAVVVETPGASGIHLLSRRTGELEAWVPGHSPSWFEDGRRITFVQGKDLWTVSVGSSEPTRLTRDDHDVRAPIPSPDGEAVAFFSRRSGHQDLWLVSATGASEPRPLTRSAMAPEETRFGFAWSPDGRHIAYISNQADFWSDDLWLIEVASGEAHRLTQDIRVSGAPAWSRDGQRIAIYGIATKEFWYGDLSDLYVVDVDSGRSRRVAMQLHAMEIGQPHWFGDDAALVFPHHARGEVDLWRVPAEGGVATRISNGGGLLHAFDARPGVDELLLVRSTPTRGREIDALAADGGPLHTLTQVATQWQDVKPPQEISFRSKDGLYIQAFMFTPPDFDPDGTYPALVQVHGGGTNSYYNGLNLVEQRLAHQGYVVLAVNYRGGSGFGRDFQDLAVDDWANGQAQDPAAAADFIRPQAWSNGKVGIYGYSYGGIMSLAAVTRWPEAFDAAVPMAGIYDWADAYETADRLGRLFTAAGHSGSPDEHPEHYARSNSLARIADVKTPILLMHGEADVRAPFRQFERVVEALEAHGKVFEAHRFPDQPHRFTDPEARVEMYRRLEAWMDRWLKTPAEERAAP